MGLVNLELLLTLVLLEELDHIRVVLELDKAEHIVAANLWHMDLTDVRGRV